MSKPVVIVGAGQTAASAVEQLRESGLDEPIVVFGREPHLPYERPPLSKGYLMGSTALAEATVHDQGWYDERDVELRLGTAVTGVDRSRRTVLAGDASQPYDRLLLATGAVPRHLASADESGAPVAYLRTQEDSTRLRESFGEGRTVAIIGGGWIGLEVAAAARTAGCEVTVLESLELPLLRVLGPEVAETFASLHRSHGVDLRTGVRIAAVEKAAERAAVRLEDGSAVTADLLVVGVGVAPDTRVAEEAGLPVDNGILVDEHLRTSDPAVFAAGDVANAYHPGLGRRVRVEHWDNAVAQGGCVARNIAGEAVPFDQLPYFFTDQYDLGMEYVGSIGPDGYDEVVLRGRPEEGTFTAFWLGSGLVLAGMHVNDWDAIEPIRRIVGGRATAEALRDASVPLADVATGPA